jgi:hypothetical protein
MPVSRKTGVSLAQHSVDNLKEIFEVVFDIPAEVGVCSKTKLSKISDLDTGLGLSVCK